MEIIGIDLGTTNSLAAVFRDGKSELIPNAAGEYLTPSAVAMEGEQLIVGRAARLTRRLTGGACAESFKRFMGTNQKIQLGERVFGAEELSACILKQLKVNAEQYLGVPVEEAVISVPAYFNDAQRRATKRAGELAGLRVERLVNEPSSAALAYYLQGNAREASYLVFDLGGGTLDVSVLEAFDNVIEIRAVAGDNQLGGDDFDRLIAEEFAREFSLDPLLLTTQEKAQLEWLARACKERLTDEAEVVMEAELSGQTRRMTMTNQRLIAIGAPLFARMKDAVYRAMRDSETEFEELDGIILVGGSSRMPVVRSYLRRLSGKRLSEAFNPDEIVALGAGLQAGMKMRRQEIKDILLSDVCPFSLGTEILHGLFSPIIERNSILPISRVRTYVSTIDMQKKMAIDIFQGERRLAVENYKIGMFNVLLPPAAAGEARVDVRFTYDVNGILEVEVNVEKGKIYRKVFRPHGSEMNEDEIQTLLKSLEHLKVHPRDREENKKLLAWGGIIFERSMGERRERIGLILRYFEEGLETQDDRVVRERYTMVYQELMRLEPLVYYGGGRNNTAGGETEENEGDSDGE